MQMEDVYFYVTHFVVLFDFFLLNLEFNFKIKRGWTAQQGISTKHYAQWFIWSAEIMAKDFNWGFLE